MFQTRPMEPIATYVDKSHFGPRAYRLFRDRLQVTHNDTLRNEGEATLRLAELDPYRNNTLAIYCRSGKRAAVADSILQSNGFAFTRNAGGLDSLRALGVPIEEAL